MLQRAYCHLLINCTLQWTHGGGASAWTSKAASCKRDDVCDEEKHWSEQEGVAVCGGSANSLNNLFIDLSNQMQY